MTHEMTLDPISSLFDDDEDVCTLINVQDLNTVSCHGECMSRPTLAPTIAPSDAPTFSPSAAPSTPPTAAPSDTPTLAPTLSPSAAPSYSPTTAPSTAPTFSPTTVPSESPTDAPSQAPSDAPTAAPSESPTQYTVTHSDFDSFFEMTFDIYGLNDDENELIAHSANSFIQNVTEFIESAFDDDDIVEFRYIDVNVTAVNEEHISVLEQKEPAQILLKIQENDHLSLSSTTICPFWACDYIIGTEVSGMEFDISSCEQFVTQKMRNYFDSELFGVDADGETSAVTVMIADYSELAMELYPEIISDEDEPYVYYGLVSISGTVALVGVLALLYEKGIIFCVKRKVDTSRWTAFIILGLQFWDFASDVLLSFELWFHDDLTNDDNRGRLILVAAIGTTTFIVIPYASNLWIAAHIRRYIKNNEAALTWYVSFGCLMFFEKCRKV